MTPVSRSPLHPLQTAIYQRLHADAALSGLEVSTYDQVPEHVEHPYVVIGDHLSIPDNAHGQFGREVTVNIHTWTKARGNLEGQTIANRIAELFDHQPLDIDGHRLVSCRLEFDQALRDPDPQIRHHVQRFRFITTQEES